MVTFSSMHLLRPTLVSFLEGFHSSTTSHDMSKNISRFSVSTSVIRTGKILCLLSGFRMFFEGLPFFPLKSPCGGKSLLSIEHLTAHHRAMTRIRALMLDHLDIDLRHQCQELNHTDLFELDNLVHHLDRNVRLVCPHMWHPFLPIMFTGTSGSHKHFAKNIGLTIYITRNCWQCRTTCSVCGNVVRYRTLTEHQISNRSFYSLLFPLAPTRQGISDLVMTPMEL